MKIVDLFCGCGGLSLGFQNAGFKIVAAYDKWQAALSVYQKNFEHECKMLDLSNIKDSVAEIESKHPDMIIGGPPCQDFSATRFLIPRGSSEDFDNDRTQQRQYHAVLAAEQCNGLRCGYGSQRSGHNRLF